MGIAVARKGEQNGLGYTVVHRSAGRLRLRLDSQSAMRATGFAASLALHPSTIEVRWVPAARSMTLHHDPSVRAEGILTSANLPRRAAVMVEKRASPGARGEALLRLLPAIGLPPLLAEIVSTLLSPPTAEVLRRL